MPNHDIMQQYSAYRPAQIQMLYQNYQGQKYLDANAICLSLAVLLYQNISLLLSFLVL
jgi:hypothetical protein